MELSALKDKICRRCLFFKLGDSEVLEMHSYPNVSKGPFKLKGERGTIKETASIGYVSYAFCLSANAQDSSIKNYSNFNRTRRNL